MVMNLIRLTLRTCSFLFCRFCIVYLFSYPSCSGATAPGLAADMHFRDDVIAFIGPACAFALEPVARLAAYWNTPIITGMGDQVSVQIFICWRSCRRK
jgi:hypothetical protein